MAYEKPPCSFNQIDKAGRQIADRRIANETRATAANTIWNWRSAHSYPLNALHTTLRNRTLRVDSTALTAQRLKRLNSILRKLRRRDTMQMSQMQDVGGCRSVVSNLTRLMALRREYESSPLRHTLTRVRDYIYDPKDDGYRSVHLMYRFSGKGTSLPWNKLRVEIQMRTALQHAWATSVETVDAFTGEDLKFGSGSANWKRFFQLIGSVHARIERTTLIPGTPASETELWEEVRDLENDLQVVRHLRSYATLTEHITGRPYAGREWYLVKMLPEENRVAVAGYPLEKFRDAKRLLAEAEKEFEGTKNQAVLVKTNSLRELKRAYPNYFADTANFTSVLDKFLQKRPISNRRSASPGQGSLF